MRVIFMARFGAGGSLGFLAGMVWGRASGERVQQTRAMRPITPWRGEAGVPSGAGRRARGRCKAVRMKKRPVALVDDGPRPVNRATRCRSCARSFVARGSAKGRRALSFCQERM